MSIQEAKNYNAPHPTKVTLFFRSFFLWQLIRFLVINIKMTLMILRSHGSKIKKKAP